MDSKTKSRSIKACDRCRIKKVKCDGAYPCIRCSKDDVTCIFGHRGKTSDQTVSISHVEQLQIQNDILTRALKAVWTRYGDAVVGKELTTHEICSLVGVLDGDIGHLSGTASLSGHVSPVSDQHPHSDGHQDSDTSMESSPSMIPTREHSPVHLNDWASYEDLASLPGLSTSESSADSEMFPPSLAAAAMPAFAPQDQQYFNNNMYSPQPGYENTFYSGDYYTFYNDMQPAKQPHHFRDTYDQAPLGPPQWPMPVPN